MKKYNAVINSTLKQGQKITLVSQGEVGGFYSINTVYDHAEPSRHYQNCPNDMIGIKIFHTPKGKRNMRVSNISYNAPIIIYDGWIDIDRDKFMFNSLPLDNEHKQAGILDMRQSKYTMFDDRYFSDIQSAFPNYILAEV
jgi:hypothetical protein